MKKLYILIFLILPLAPFACSKNEDYVVINNTNIELIGIADDADKAYMGLSFKESMCEDCGMLFPFDEKKVRTFAMRDMMFPLDIIWIDDNKIVKIHKNLEPEGHIVQNLYSSDFSVNNVLEVNAGFSDKNNIKVGDELHIY